jgi:hypothetical protein
VDAKIWTVGATLFAILYLTLAVTLVWSAVVVALILAAWVMGMETEGAEGLRYVELEMRPALAFVGIFSATVVILGPHFPDVIGRDLAQIQYAAPMVVERTTPVLFYFPILPLLAGVGMTAHQTLHPLGGVVYQTAPPPSTKVHVHLHGSRAARAAEEEEGEEDEDAPRSRRSQKHHHFHPRLRRAPKVHAASDDEEDEDDDEEEDEAPVRHRRRHATASRGSAEL